MCESVAWVVFATKTVFRTEKVFSPPPRCYFGHYPTILCSRSHPTTYRAYQHCIYTYTTQYTIIYGHFIHINTYVCIHIFTTLPPGASPPPPAPSSSLSPPSGPGVSPELCLSGWPLARCRHRMFAAPRLRASVGMICWLCLSWHIASSTLVMQKKGEQKDAN